MISPRRNDINDGYLMAPIWLKLDIYHPHCVDATLRVRFKCHAAVALTTDLISLLFRIRLITGPSLQSAPTG